MLMQRKMGLAVASVTVILTIMTFAPYLVPVAVTSDGTESNGTTPDNTLPEAPPPGTLAYWKLNENSGSYASDSVDPPVDGYIQGGSMWIPGVSGSGLNLSTNQYIDFGTNTGLYALNYLTIEAWVNLEDTSGLHTIIMNAYSSIYIMYHFGIEDGHIYFHRQSAQPSSSYTSPGTISAGEWHHVAIVMNGGGRYLSFYIDGLEEQMITNYDGYHGPAGFATIGADRVTGTPSFLDGMVDEVIVFDTILTHTMIWDHYQKGLRGLGYFDDIPPNEAPVANDDSYTMDQDAVLSEGAPGILANDIDNDGDSLETDLISGPTNGALTLNPDGSFVYTPAGGFVGVDSFEYRAFDGTDYSSSATVTITVQAVDHPPVAVDDEYATNEDLLLSIASPGVLVNDYDPDSGDIITSELVTGPEHGSLTFFSEGGFEYVPNPDWFGTDSFIYRAFDGQVYGNEATVTITVTGVNDVPIAGDDSYSGTEDAVLVGSSVLDNDIDPDGDYLEINLISLPSYGVLTLNPDGSFTFVPDADWYGTDSFTYELYDGQLFSNTATVTITISSVNDVPVSYDDTFSVDEDVDLTEFLSATDVDEDSLTYELVSGTSNGILIFRSTGTFTYSPNANWFGTDTFTFWVYDGQEYSNIATITILVTSINDIPIAGDDEFTTDEDTTLIGSVLDNDYDVEWDLQEVYLESGPSYGGLDLNTDTGVFTYYPEANWFGIDYFTYYVFDGYAYSNIATVTITVNGVNDAPFVFDVYYIGYEGVDLNRTLPSGTDVEGDSLTYELVTGPSHGILTFSPDGNFTFIPASGWYGIDTFTYRAFDGSDYSNIGTVTIEIVEEDDVTGPEITIIYSGDSTDGSPGFWNVTVIDPESGVDSINVEIDGVSVGTTEGIYAVPNSLGDHTITVTATNADLDYGPADQETSTASDSVTIMDDDVTGPTLSIVYTGDYTDINPGFWTITASDLESGIYSISIEIDGVIVGSTEGDYPVPGSVGTHSLTVIVINNDMDRPDDQEITDRSLTVYIEQTTSVTEITYTGDLIGAYSDPVHLEALLFDITNQLPLPGMTIMFTLGTQTAYAVTNADGVASVVIILDQQEGVYELTVSFAEVDDYLGSSSTSEFFIYRECAVTIYSGVTLVEVSEESLSLRATIFDDADGYWGDITHIYVTFMFYLSSDPAKPVHVTSPVRVEATEVAGVGIATLEIPNLPEGNYLVMVSLQPEHNRYYCSPESDAASLSIYEPERAHVHGLGIIKGPDGHYGYFAFNVKYTCKGSLHGFILYSYAVDDWVYLVKGCDIIGLDTDGRHGFFEAYCTIIGFNFKTCERVVSSDAYRVRIDVFDNKKSPERDVFQIRIFDKLGLVEYEAGYEPFGYLLKGCIKVKHGRKH